MSVKLLTEHHLEFLEFKGGCTASSEFTPVKIPHCWKVHVTANIECRKGHGYRQDPHQNQHVPCLQLGDITIARGWLFCTVIGLVKFTWYTNLNHFCLHDLNGFAQ